MPEDGLGFSQPGQSLQRMRRTWRIFTDQHGRKFGAVVDTGNGHPIGELIPQGFTPPWQPPMAFAKFADVHVLDFRWDYEGVASELGGVTANWYQMVIAWAIEFSKPEPEVGGPVDRSIVYGYGKPPLSPAIPLACELGVPWILGTPGAPVDENLKKILEQNVGANGKEAIDFIRSKLIERSGTANVPLVPSAPVVPKTKEVERTINDLGPLEEITYPEFLKACRGKKMSIGDIAQAWTEHKKALAQELQGAA